VIILPDKNIPRSRFLLPVRKRDWNLPSRAQQKCAIGNEDQTRFRITARLHDGHIVWRGWFDDRDDFDAFLWALFMGSLKRERDLWDLPTPAWRPGLGPDLLYDFATVTFYTATGGATFSVPVDYTSSGSKVEAICCHAHCAEPDSPGSRATRRRVYR
jgi:hypothetical protein